MWYLVQQDPGETVALGCYENYEDAKSKLMNLQRFNSHCFYEIMHSSDLMYQVPYENLVAS